MLGWLGQPGRGHLDEAPAVHADGVGGDPVVAGVAGQHEQGVAVPPRDVGDLGQRRGDLPEVAQRDAAVLGPDDGADVEGRPVGALHHDGRADAVRRELAAPPPGPARTGWGR